MWSAFSVLISEGDGDVVQEILYLNAIPGMGKQADKEKNSVPDRVK